MPPTTQIEVFKTACPHQLRSWFSDCLPALSSGLIHFEHYLITQEHTIYREIWQNDINNNEFNAGLFSNKDIGGDRVSFNKFIGQPQVNHVTYMSNAIRVSELLQASRMTYPFCCQLSSVTWFVWRITEVMWLISFTFQIFVLSDWRSSRSSSRGRNRRASECSRGNARYEPIVWNRFRFGIWGVHWQCTPQIPNRSTGQILGSSWFQPIIQNHIWFGVWVSELMIRRRIGLALPYD